ncbi:MAG: hypothetical protein SLAVMIC_00250 [uncultured marine phage]|uniref:Uncharacterized protein n=1 Tax=uncultured marine phage TaxID=707152 RepID=A0A8D9CDT6_9VIRU|nr:MAG: hypothetical protein SLAVMIC_00250 [uncultured marine phage]
MFKKLGNNIKNFDLRKFINKTFKVCFHKYEKVENENQFGRFVYDKCVCCAKTKNTEISKPIKIESNIEFSQEREDRLSKILDK